MKCDIGCATGQWGEDGFDHAAYQYRQQPGNFEYAKNIHWKFMDAPFIANLCEDEYNVADLLKQSSKQTYLVHSKFPFLTSDEQWLRRTFIAVNGRYSTPQDRKIYISPKFITDGSMDYDKVINELCDHDERRRYIEGLSTKEELVITTTSTGAVGADTAHARPSPRARAMEVCSDAGRARLLSNAHAPPMSPPGKQQHNDVDFDDHDTHTDKPPSLTPRHKNTNNNNDDDDDNNNDVADSDSTDRPTLPTPTPRRHRLPRTRLTRHE
jgi:hypothetical protein